MKMLLLVSAVALLVSAAHIQASGVNANRIKLNAIYDQAEKCSKSLTEDIFVENVSHLAQGKDKCGVEFFCKVQQILLNKQEDFCGNKKLLVRTLQAYNRNVQCENKVQGVTTNVEVQLSRLFSHVIGCVRHRNFHGTYKK